MENKDFLLNNFWWVKHIIFGILLLLTFFGIGIVIDWYIASAFTFLLILYFIISLSSGKPRYKRYAHIFGTPVGTWNAEDGLIFAPLLFVTIIEIPAEKIESYIPGTPELVFHGSESEKLPEGMVRTLYITTNDIDTKNDEFDIIQRTTPDKETLVERTKDELYRSLTLEPEFQVVFQFSDTNLSYFFKNYSNANDAIKAVNAKVIAIAQELFGRKTPATLLENQKKVRDYILDKLRESHFSGITILDFFIISIGLPKRVSEALADVSKAELIAKASNITNEQDVMNAKRLGLNQAEITKLGLQITRENKNLELKIDRTNLEKTGQINAQNQALAIELTLAAKAKGTKQLADELGITEKQILLFLPALEKLSENPNLDINLFGGGNDLQNLLTKFLTKK
jgi:regulator of protease activity HflC (stomatin/prohibitin superfamily)